jgi:hypothetical protein
VALGADDHQVGSLAVRHLEEALGGRLAFGQPRFGGRCLA